MVIELEISDEAFDLLVKMNDKGFAEYRDAPFDTVDDYYNFGNYSSLGEVPEKNSKNTSRFLNRNFGGTLHLIPELEEIGLVKYDVDAWHSTYKITDIGKQVIRTSRINIILEE